MNIVANKVMVGGDVHGDISVLNEFINKNNPDVLFITGDLAFLYNNLGFTDYDKTYPILSTESLDKVKPKNTKIFWVAGNHEAWDAIISRYNRYGKEPIEIKTNIWYCPLGSTLTLNGKICLFVGGAKTYDYEGRYKGVDWFPEHEIITYLDLETITSMVKKVDYVFTHTCPSTFDITVKWDPFDKVSDPSRVVLEEIRDYYKPHYWFFGHWHRYHGGSYKGTIWQCMNTFSKEYHARGRAHLDISSLFIEDNSGSSDN